MILSNSPELFWLVLTTALTGVLWIPYILQFLAQEGPVNAIMDGSGEHPSQAAWAGRAHRAHLNAVENLVVFAPLAILVHTLGAGDALTAGAAMVFFYARLTHFIVYTLGLPLVRTLAFVAGFACQAILALRLLGVL